ncbi:phosphoribosyl-AMP cyclohydrolase [Methanoplanus limicola]|uniref:Phosphoribosyl-AMP cyclohydrolase n=1 Tax=Methanoplanus limicola DSM 2279 TaxID=937775 RepID=H1YWJ8_9EURY|nr:phosphoribosyl-AMP cyclohydrolase [Methanoplanus limicola]EHQ35800.1 phosphoribosyl-AMP cyclohydrolase [Methanoplanus limicola DSM 2279]
MEIKYNENNLVPVIVQDCDTKAVLMLAYADKEALSLTIDTGFAHYYSRSRNKMWKKGEESGHTQEIVKILKDCDSDTLLYQVRQKGAPCHTGYDSCFYRTIEGEIIGKKIFDPEKVYSGSEKD